MDIESLYRQFGPDSETGTSDSAGLNIHSLVSEFGSDKTAKRAADKAEAIKIRPVAPPISGVDQETSDELNSRVPQQGGANPRAMLPSTNIQERAYEGHLAGKALMTEAANDFESGHPYKALAKGFGGVLQTLTAPAQGIVEGTVGKLATDITGNPDFGDKASFVVQSALPISKVGKTIVEAIPKNKAFRSLVDAIGPENTGKVAAEMRANPRLTPADLSPAVRQTTQKLFVTEGDKTKNYLAQSVQGRLDTAKQAVEDAFNKGMGQAVNAKDKLNILKQNIKAKGAEINPVIQSTKPVDLTDTISYIDKQIKPGVNSVISSGQLPLGDIQNELKKVRSLITNDKAVMTDPTKLQQLQSVFRSTADRLLNSANGHDRQMGYALMQVRNHIVDAIDAASPKIKNAAGDEIGSYKPKLAGYRDELHIQDAFEHGHDSILKNTRQLQDRPEFFKSWVKSATPEELEAAKEGARVAIDTQINGFKSAARRGTDIGEVEFNKDRIRALFGDKEANELFKTLKHERMIAETNSDLVKGSQTAMRQTADTRIALPTKSEIGQGMLVGAGLESANILAHGYPGIGTSLLLAAKGGNEAKHIIATKLAKEHNAQFTKYALPTNGPNRDNLIRSLEAVAAQQNQKPSLLRKVTSAARLIAP